MQKRKEDPKLYRCLTLQIHGKNGWEDSVTLTLEQPEKGPSGQVSLTYIDDYFTPENRIDHLGACGLPAAWIQMPLEYGLTSRHTSWPVFFSDLIPTGAAQNYWRKFLNLEYQPEGLMLATLLQRGTISPIGNLRIKEAFEQALFDGLDQALS
ncbi:hypothetical protein [Marinospirillum sp.]|uniref:hypothetical protein n=1 Tax=Marinospirillum sp. TaxID=2183934 RepID=UPI003A845110